MAFHTFLSLGVAATVLEVGIGGTYDSTNLVPKPVVTGITSLGLDHVAVLGNTIQEIALNKGGIYKPGVPALSVLQDQAGEVLEGCAKKVDAPFSVVPTLPAGTVLGLRGEHQRINAGLAVGLAKIFLRRQGGAGAGAGSGAGVESDVAGGSEGKDLPESFKEPLRLTKWPGRCQRVVKGDTTWFLDGAHTTESLASCGEWAWGVGGGGAGGGAVAEGESTEGRVTSETPDVLVFNCSGGRTGQVLLTALLESGARTAGESVKELGKRFQAVVFCTNVTYTDGHFKGGEWCRWDPTIHSQLYI